jgi:hypothetical protein
VRVAASRPLGALVLLYLSRMRSPSLLERQHGMPASAGVVNRGPRETTGFIGLGDGGVGPRAGTIDRKARSVSMGARPATDPPCPNQRRSVPLRPWDRPWQRHLGLARLGSTCRSECASVESTTRWCGVSTPKPPCTAPNHTSERKPLTPWCSTGRGPTRLFEDGSGEARAGRHFVGAPVVAVGRRAHLGHRPNLRHCR